MKSIFTIEFFFNVSPKILFPRLNNPGGLVEWFADEIRVKDDLYTFIWNGMEQQAKLLHQKKNKYVRFQWLDDPEEQAYFEFKILQDDITGDVVLLVTDFAEETEKNDAMNLWKKQIGSLKKALGVS
jgi:hypothetical protein